MWTWLVKLLGLLKPPAPPVPPAPPAPESFDLFVSVFRGDPAGDHKVAGAKVTIADRVAYTDAAGNCDRTLGRFDRGRYLISVQADGYKPIVDAGFLVPEDIGQGLRVSLYPLAPPVVVLPRLVRSGQVFALETGERFTAIEASDFNLLNRWQHGEDIEPVLAQRAMAGFNMLRVWTLYNLPAASIGTFLDINYARVPAFLVACARHGLYVEFTAYTSTFDHGEHWNNLIAAVRSSTNVLVELVNENDQPANTIDTNRFPRPVGVLASHGSNGAESWPVDPYWDYGTFHTNGAYEEQRKIGHNAWEIWSGPTLTNETSRYPEIGMWRGASLERAKALSFDSAAGAALLAAGSCFHSVLGKSSRLWDADTCAVATAWADGARSVPLFCQGQPYHHRVELETEPLLRVYQRGDDPACIVRIRK